MFSPSRAILASFGLVVLSVRLAQPERLLAQGPGCCCPPPCAPACCCPPPPPTVCTCTSYHPVCDTCYHQQPIVTYRDVCHTCCRQEPYCVTVPVTRFHCVTCDEGCYKMVWCPHVVSHQVPHTEYRQQVCCRTVPYTVTQRVPQVMTQVVPEYRVRYCPETHTFIKPPCNPCPCNPCPCCPPVAPGCGVPRPYMGQAMPAGYPTQGMAEAPSGQPQQPVLEPSAAPMVPVGQGQSVGAIASTGPDMSDPYLRARAAANVWQSNPNMAAQ